MRAIIDPDTCLGCGICTGIAPDVFSLGAEPFAVVLLNPIPEKYWPVARDAAEQCPEEAITIEE